MAFPSRRFVNVGFALIGAGVIFVTLFALVQARRLEDRTHAVVDNMLTDIRLVGELERDVGKVRVLIDDHIFTDSRAEMDRLEMELRQVQERLATTMRAFDEWGERLPGERGPWDQTRAGLRALTEPMARAVALSRAHRDRDAHRAMQEVAALFAAVDRDLDALVAVNQRGADEAVAEVSRLKRQLSLVLLALGMATIAGTFLVGRWVSRQVDEREAEMARAARELEQRNRELDAFSARVAHDLRGPLMTISLAAEQLARKAAAPGERAATTIRKGIGRMESLVDDLLTLAQVESRARGACDPAEVAAHLRDDFAPRLEANQGALRVDVQHARVPCSEGLLRQTLANLVENAIKYRRDDVPPQVQVSGAVSNGGYDLRVSDNGLGMSDDDARQVFEPFYRSPETRNVPGTGLGLSIVKRIAEASGGSVAVQAKLGEGSTFVVHLPRSDQGGGHPDRR